jgi:quercetin dioxygenase-like cupin family protein|tara:strand:+ start:3377 stop:3727 length:351 start_codon:yes stop_codon:yes gene_type:complete
MAIQGKVWGKTQGIFKNSNFEIHRIEIKKGGYCSKHKHEYKFNAFYVENGKLKITIYETDYDLVDETSVSTGELTTVKPGAYHKFEALEDTICYEIYWVELNHNDIKRENTGGCKG